MHGEGTIRYARIDDEEYEDGDEKPEKEYYEGMFENGYRTEGLMTYACGDKFVGTFDQDGMKINGTLFYKNGNKYEGEFEEGYRKQGIMTYKTKDKYTGEFKDG